MPPAPASLGVERAGMWLSEKARRSCREEVGEGKEERKKGRKKGVDELRSNILRAFSERREEEAEVPLRRPRDLNPRVFIYIAAAHRMEPPANLAAGSAGFSFDRPTRPLESGRAHVTRCQFHKQGLEIDDPARCR